MNRRIKCFGWMAAVAVCGGFDQMTARAAETTAPEKEKERPARPEKAVGTNSEVTEIRKLPQERQKSRPKPAHQFKAEQRATVCEKLKLKRSDVSVEVKTHARRTGAKAG